MAPATRQFFSICFHLGFKYTLKLLIFTWLDGFIIATLVFKHQRTWKDLKSQPWPWPWITPITGLASISSAERTKQYWPTKIKVNRCFGSVLWTGNPPPTYFATAQQNITCWWNFILLDLAKVSSTKSKFCSGLIYFHTPPQNQCNCSGAGCQALEIVWIQRPTATKVQTQTTQGERGGTAVVISCKSCTRSICGGQPHTSSRLKEDRAMTQKALLG